MIAASAKPGMQNFMDSPLQNTENKMLITNLITTRMPVRSENPELEQLVVLSENSAVPNSLTCRTL